MNPTLTLPPHIADHHATRFAVGHSCHVYVATWAWHIRPTAGEEVVTINGNSITVYWPQDRPLTFPFTPTAEPHKR